ncbi:hypothetical protein FQR65_LT07639 [Abscondita terminalis]|nr:hypothetical protein FQR65_LT07639 [Abscondita terminalis]
MKPLVYLTLLLAILFEIGADSTQDCLTNISSDITSNPDEMNTAYLCIWQKEGVLNEEGTINNDALKKIAERLVSDDTKNLETISEVSDYIVEVCSKLDNTLKHFGINLHLCIEECISTKLGKNDNDV